MDGADDLDFDWLTASSPDEEEAERCHDRVELSARCSSCSEASDTFSPGLHPLEVAKRGPPASIVVVPMPHSLLSDGGSDRNSDILAPGCSPPSTALFEFGVTVKSSRKRQAEKPIAEDKLDEKRRQNREDAKNYRARKRDFYGCALAASPHRILSSMSSAS